MLDKPIQIGSMEIKNRLVKAAVVENMATETGEVSESMIELYQRVARGGAGLIITGGAYVQPNGRNVKFQTGVHHDGLIPTLSKLAKAGQEDGAKIVLQISHGGRQCNPELVGGEVVGPSPVKDSMTKITPRMLSAKEIDEIIDAFRLASGRVQAAGFDGVEIMAGHGYLINGFLSRRTNRRKDEWGGLLENRARFLFTIIEKVRDIVGPDYPILVKLNTEDQMKNGLTLKESAWIASRLQDLGINAIKFTGGTYESALNIARGDIPEDEILENYQGWERIRLKLIIRALRKKFKFSEAYFLENVKKVRCGLQIPVILVGGLRTPAVMESILRNGHSDMIALGRPLIREPHFARKILSGDESSSSCTSCNRCFIRVSQEMPVRCYRGPDQTVKAKI